MRVALLQIRLNSTSQAANLQGINAAIDEAANASPAPEVLVLPGACDTGGVNPGRGRSEAVLQGVKESIAWKAREWGVPIAVGLHVRRARAYEPCAVLFDADGDVVARSVPPARADDLEADGPVRLWSSAVGDVGVLEVSIATPFESQVAAGLGRAMVAIPVSRFVTEKRRRTAEANLALLRSGSAAGGDVYWAVVATAAPAKTAIRDGITTFLCGPDGKVLASADGPEQAVVHAEVPIEGP